VPVVTAEVAGAYGDDFRSLVDEVSAAMTTADLTELNRQFDIDARDADEIATDWLTENGFLEG
jgi:osmoprotectant transport system substrate-binding protein